GADDCSVERAIADGETKLLRLGFLDVDIEPQQVAIDRRRPDLENVKETRAHHFPEFLVECFRTVRTAAQLLESIDEILSTQLARPFHPYPIEIIARSEIKGDSHRHPSMQGQGWIPDRFHFHS